MVLRKITVDNSVKSVPKSEQTKEIKQNTLKNKKQIQPISGRGKPNKKLSENNKKWIASGFRKLTKFYLYKHKNNYIAIHIRISVIILY